MGLVLHETGTGHLRVLDLIHGKVLHPWKVVLDPWRSVSTGALQQVQPVVSPGVMRSIDDGEESDNGSLGELGR